MDVSKDENSNDPSLESLEYPHLSPRSRTTPRKAPHPFSSSAFLMFSGITTDLVLLLFSQALFHSWKREPIFASSLHPTFPRTKYVRQNPYLFISSCLHSLILLLSVSDQYKMYFILSYFEIIITP